MAKIRLYVKDGRQEDWATRLRRAATCPREPFQIGLLHCAPAHTAFYSPHTRHSSKYSFSTRHSTWTEKTRTLCYCPKFTSTFPRQARRPPRPRPRTHSTGTTSGHGVCVLAGSARRGRRYGASHPHSPLTTVLTYLHTGPNSYAFHHNPRQRQRQRRNMNSSHTLTSDRSSWTRTGASCFTQ